MRKRRKISNPLALAVLGLLQERPMHPYEMAGTLRERNKDGSFKINTGSLYDVVEALQREGWICARETVREGRRPERTVYAHTESGHTEFVRWLDELLRVPAKEYPKFLAAVSYLGALGRDAAADALTERSERLAEECAVTRATLAGTTEAGVPRLFMIELEYALRMREAELEWVRAIVGEITDGTLTWPRTGTRTGSTAAP